MIEVPASLRSDFIHIVGTLIHFAGIRTEFEIYPVIEDGEAATAAKKVFAK
jgi:hypothetical protein